ncbi:HalD/BesD family halogenase [Actinomadura rubrisoli]|uniref:ArpA protein n=1 Tax=Actinomadura rubrisoli TaxID=2530368 RepID=A0A4R5CBW4_9ACTN|nr:arpA protein [Actinomadura rubrisoli]TDD94624.1 arpA protein [Actinomadura rubrisoli]
MRTAEARDVGRAVDTERYPLADPGGAAWAAVVSRTRAELAESGCCVLPDFIRPDLHGALRAECAALAPRAHYGVETVNAYNIDVNSPLPDNHPGRITVKRGNAFVARDHIPADSIIGRLYTSEPFRRFVAGCFGLPRVHELADPLSGLCLNVVNPGMEHPWHFDTNEFTVTLLTQGPADGGAFEYCPNIRSADAENFQDVQSVLTGGGGHLIRRLTLRPGDLQLFKGRYSLHRVSTVRGATARHTAIFAYSERPGVIGSVERTRQLFGRVLPEHPAAEGRAVRIDRLLD